MGLLAPLPLAALRLVGHEIDRCRDYHRLIRRERRGEAVGGAGHSQNFGDQSIGGNVTSDGTVGLAQRTHVEQALTGSVEMFQDAAAGGAEHTGAVGVVDIEHGVPPRGETYQIGDWGDVAVLTEQAIGDDDFGCRSRLAQQLFEMIQIEMAIGVSSGARQAHAFPNTDVVVFVTEIRVGVLSAARETVDTRNLRGARQRGQNAEISQISRREQDRVALAFGASDLALELAIEREVASEQPRIAVADAIGFDAANGGSPHARTCCNSQIVVGAERDVLPIFPPERQRWKTVYTHRLARRTPPAPICQLCKLIHARLLGSRAPPRMHNT